jgi:hypothetical protein
MEVSRGKTYYIRSDSEFVRSIGKHRIGELIAMANVSIDAIRDEHGDEVADALAELGNEITTKVNDTIRWCVSDTPAIAGKATAYLTSVVSANVAVAIFTALDELKFEMELEEYQKSGGTE